MVSRKLLTVIFGNMIKIKLLTVSSVLDLTVSHITMTPAGAVQKILYELVVMQLSNPYRYNYLHF